MSAADIVFIAALAAAAVYVVVLMLRDAAER